MFFWYSVVFSMIQWMFTIWFQVPLPFWNPAWISGSSWFTYCWSLAWKILSMWDECSCAVLCDFFGFAFLLDWNEIQFHWPISLVFSSPVATVELSKFAGIFSAALLQHHLSGFEITQLEFHHLHLFCLSWCFLRSTWLHIPGCLALGEWSHHLDYLGNEELFLYSSSVYSWHLFLISSASISPYHFCHFQTHLCMKYSLAISNFIEKIARLFHLTFPSVTLHCVTEEGFLTSPCYSLELWIQIGISLCFAFVFHFSSFHSYL